MCFALYQRHSFVKDYVSTSGYSHVGCTNGESESDSFVPISKIWRNILVVHVIENT